MSIELKYLSFVKTFRIALDCLVECFRLHAVQRGDVAIEQHLLIAYREHAGLHSGDVYRLEFGSFPHCPIPFGVVSAHCAAERRFRLFNPFSAGLDQFQPTAFMALVRTSVATEFNPLNLRSSDVAAHCRPPQNPADFIVAVLYRIIIGTIAT